jgi:hypothetical protein
MPVIGAPAYPWYCVVFGADLEQGDLLLDCPVYRIPPAAIRAEAECTVTVERQNVIVLTQSCDLTVQQGKSKVDDVIMAAVYFKRELSETRPFHGNDGWENARKGKYPGYHVLNKCEMPDFGLDFMIVDFRRIFTLGVDAVRAFAAANGKGRVRLLPPYREHLAQSFARFFMRIGLPVDIPAFK